MLPILVQYDKIVCISDAMFDLQFALEKVIKFVHVYVHQKLAREIAKRQTDAWPALNMETPDDLA